jgi:hypothetical protein
VLFAVLAFTGVISSGDRRDPVSAIIAATPLDVPLDWHGVVRTDKQEE